MKENEQSMAGGNNVKRKSNEGRLTTSANQHLFRTASRARNRHQRRYRGREEGRWAGGGIRERSYLARLVGFALLAPHRVSRLRCAAHINRGRMFSMPCRYLSFSFIKA